MRYTACLLDNVMYVHDRRSLRLDGYDYAQVGAYFVTVCTQDRACLLGDVAGEEVQLSDAGRMAQEAWQALPGRFSGMELDAFVVMPNHVHGIIVIPGRGESCEAVSQPHRHPTEWGQRAAIRPLYGLVWERTAPETSK